ncbi:CHAP domain-containing protein [Myxococcaceae bacterium GXIMD 01537]
MKIGSSSTPKLVSKTVGNEAGAKTEAKRNAPLVDFNRSSFKSTSEAKRVDISGDGPKPKSLLDIAQEELDTYGGNGSEYYGWSKTGKTDWCASFVSYVYAQAGIPLGTDDYRPNGCNGIVHCDQLKRWLEDTGQWIPKEGATPQPGDIVVFDFDGDGYMDHTGIVKSYDPKTGELVCIEGNAGGGERGAGDGDLMEVTHANLDDVAGFGRVTPPTQQPVQKPISPA